MKPPRRLKIGATTYLVKRSGKTLMFGETDNLKTHITLHAGQSEDSMRDTLLHEALHAIAWCAGAQKLLRLDDETEEALVRLLSPYLVALLRDNPELIAYLLA